MTQYDLLFLLNAVGIIKPAASQEPAVPGRNWLEPPAPQEFWLLRWALGTWHRRLDSWLDTPVATNRGIVLMLVLLTFFVGSALIQEGWAESRNMSRHLTKLERQYAREQSEFCWWLVHTKSPAYQPGSFLIELQEQMSVSDFDIFVTSRFYAHVHEHCLKK